MREKTRVKNHEKGFALIELITVIAIVGIISGVLIPSFLGITSKAKKKVCSINSLRTEEMYDFYLYEKGKEHSAIVFNEYIQEEDKDICPDGGIVIYEGGKVQCSVHSLDEDDDKGDVPYL